MKVIVIGGVASGMSAASKIKRNDKSAEVIVYEAGEHLSYGACGLPYYISGINDDSNKLIARTESEFNKSGIETRIKHKVLKVIPERKEIFIHDSINNQLFIDSYDKLLIATGAVATVPPIEGRDLKGVYHLKTLSDGLFLKKLLEENACKNIVIVGGGYIGLEVAETLKEQGKNITVIEYSHDILAPFDKEISQEAVKELVNLGINLKLQEGVTKILGNSDGDAVEVVTDKGRYSTDLVILATGIKPATNFLKGSGINLRSNGAIIIDREMRTNVPDIYAAGDCAEVYHLVKEENDYIPLGTTANKCGRIAGDNMLGAHQKFVGTMGSAAIKIGNLELARTGLSEHEAKKLSYDYDTVTVMSQDHPNYYPNPTSIKLKLIYEKRTLRLLGAQGVGEKGVVLRIDMFAIAIQNKMATNEIGMVDLCYAPPFAGVWDAVHIASNAAK
ncbi:CoA-disulfide reductase [Vagococcus fluvialis]|uniref:CoA-disulfide reductase n=1 Tax=Vagococcus fluvialis TaxID=2738 RepID=UPI001D09E20E|nr:CoA-disulfide reductase [Vagococcus fluvialis]UDM71569.1 CoA-disulfide reductase [Vagococcus fluvialis]UDM76430.1 CoA-disulfide reductase [Vagococcus fluvialis]UDM83260.1 CoA-disulfide reductase [Vagococcus fluvialis]